MKRTVLALAAVLAFPPAASAIPPVYVTNQGSATVSAFASDPNGALTPIGSPAATGSSPTEVALTPDGRFAYVANSGSPGSVSAFAVGGAGDLTSLGAPVPTGGNGANALAVSSGGTRLYVTNGTAPSHSITTFAIGADGSLAPVGSPVPTGGIVPRAVVAAPDGGHLYVANNSTSTITTFAIGGNGEPVQQGAPLDPPGHDTFDLAISPGGDRLYVANFGTGDVTTLAVAADGALSELGDPVPTGLTMPRALALSGDGTRMLVTSSGAPQGVALLAIGGDGRPVAVGAPAPAGGSPYGVAFSPSGTIGFVAGPAALVTPFRAIGDGAPAAGGATPTGGTSPRGAAVRPGQTPTASFTAAAGRAKTATVFDASASSDADGTVAGYLWNFGDGTSPAGGARPSHVYAKPGTYTVTLAVVDADGCSTRRTFTGKTVACNGSGAATTTRVVKVGAAARATTGLRTKKAGLSRKGRVTLKLSCRATGVKRCAGKLTLSARLSRTKKKASRIGAARFSVKRGRTLRLTVRLSSAARRALASRRLKASVRLATDQPAGKDAIGSGKVKLSG